ncbi:MAG: nucleoside-diphosphate kinase [Firmicutes bacterium]|nr:nucleoside-diphosphate kinase [Bacillota bacterium]
MEKTLVIIKPDGVKRKLMGEIIKRYENKGFNIINAKLIKADKKTVKKHYEEHKNKDFFKELVDYILEDFIFVMIIEGENAINIVRTINGHKDPLKALPGTIRGDFANSLTRNIIHASDSKESSEREIKIWF